MVVHIDSVAFTGIEPIPVDVQVQISLGIPSFTIVGLADKTIAESKERVKASLSSIGQSLPAKKILINLAPADLIKEGSHYDLPIACAILTALGTLPKDEMEEYIVLGELSLDSTILPVSGILPAAISANSKNKGIICSYANGSEASWSANNKILAPKNLLQLINHFKGAQFLTSPLAPQLLVSSNNWNYKEIIGQKIAKRALEVAASGGHNLLMSGPPGTGKSSLAIRLPSILPPLDPNEVLECSIIASIAGQLKDNNLITTRPFRAPHHSCSNAAMIGGGIGKKVKPGEISLAHRGILFLDELPEFPQNIIDSLRQPIETGEISISRANSYVKFPADFQLIAAMNPCKCGYIDDLARACSKAPKCGNDYLSKLSGPIMDRFDMFVNVMNDNDFLFNNTANEEDSSKILKRVLAARILQKKRLEKYSISLNKYLQGKALLECSLPTDNEGQKLVIEVANKLKLSIRSYNKLLKVARTIADLDNSDKVYKIHVSEAISYRFS